MKRPKIPLLAEPKFPHIGPARMVNGYIAYYTKEKHTIYEHDLVAEVRLGRSLLSTELAHHKNHIRHDNSDANIEVKTYEQHTREHMQERVPAERQSSDKKCPVCGNLFFGAADRVCCSPECSHKTRITPGRPTREQLDRMLVLYSKSAIARVYGVSEAAVRKWNRNLK